MALNANALTTLATAKSHLSISPNDTAQDARVELFINAASQRIESITDRLLLDQGPIVEFQHGRRENILLLRQFPILTVTELWVDSTHLFTDPLKLIPATDYGIGDDLNSIVYYERVFPNGYQNIQVKYTAGYVAVPSDLELACLWLVEWFYLHRGRQDMGRTTASKGDESVGILASMPPMIQEILLHYKRTEMPLLNAPIRNL
jgi:uncharacterized phiE125 gp8 family phage protein